MTKDRHIEAVMFYPIPTRWLASRNLTVSVMSKGVKEPIEKNKWCLHFGNDWWNLQCIFGVLFTDMYARGMFKCSHQLSCSSFLTHRWEGKKFRNSIITGEMDQIIVK